jgi:arabinose-5-phosphate isomerase
MHLWSLPLYGERIVSLETARRVLRLEARAIDLLTRRLDETFNDALKVLFSTKGRVVVTGMGKSGLVGAKIAATFSSTGTPAFVLDPAQALHGDMGVVTRYDTILALSNSGTTEELKVLLPLVQKVGCRVVLMTGKPEGILSRFSDVVLNVGVPQEACPLNLAPTSSTTVALAMGDALAVALLEKHKFTEKDFARVHPAGSLGARLKETVGDIMRRGKALPLVKAGDSFQKVARVITEKKVGCACVVDVQGVLRGIVVDGDLRRAMLKDPNASHWTAKDLSNPKPRVIEPGATLGEALQIMEEYAVYQLVVVDPKRRPTGLLHLHDLLGRGQVKIS